jgi:hypothetical protein
MAFAGGPAEAARFVRRAGGALVRADGAPAGPHDDGEPGGCGCGYVLPSKAENPRPTRGLILV